MEPDKILLQKAFYLIKARLINTIRLDLDSDYRNTILLSSLGRSGSTLISNLINYKNDYRIIFEPFKHNKVKEAAQFNYPTYIDPLEASDVVKKSMDKILRGKIRNWWTDKPNEKLITRKRLIKDIYTNMMLGWIKSHYPEIPVILLIRNPFTTIESWIRSGWGFVGPKNRMFEQQSSLEPLIPNYIFDEYKSETSTVGNHFYNWCINYYVPLKTLNTKEVFITYYEHYLQNPLPEAQNLFIYLNKHFDEHALEKLNEFSFTTRKDSPLKKSENILIAWKKKFSREEINNGMKILSKFGFDTLYNYESGLPATK